MYLTRTPLRISLFGGGTDYAEYFERKPGAVVGMAIDKYINIAAIKLTQLQDYKYRLSYSKLEMVQEIADLKHPVVRETLLWHGHTCPLDISIMSDLPASGSGLGSSSSFTVGLLNLLNHIHEKPCTKIDLAKSAIHIERTVLQENGGIQDQMHAAFGGINRFDFSKDKCQITPLQLSGETLKNLNQSLMLVHTGIIRSSSDTAKEQREITKKKQIDQDLSELYKYVDDCVSILEGGGANCFADLGELLNESWKIKRSLSKSITNSAIDELYKIIMAAGAYGAKLCGAGGGGYFAVLIDPDKKATLSNAVHPLSSIEVQIDVLGSQIL